VYVDRICNVLKAKLVHLELREIFEEWAFCLRSMTTRIV